METLTEQHGGRSQASVGWFRWIPVYQTLQFEAPKSSTGEVLKLLGKSLFLGIMADVLFHGFVPGISVLYFVVLCLFFLFTSLVQIPSRRAPISLLIIGCMLLLAGTFALFTNPILGQINLVLLPFLYLVLALLLGGRNLYAWEHPYILVDGCVLIRNTIRNLVDSSWANDGSLEFSPGRVDMLRRVGIGALISIPLTVLVFNLLVSADTVFEQTMFRWYRKLIGNSFREVVQHLAVILVVGLLFFGFLRTLLERYAPHVSASPVPNRIADPLILNTVLVQLNVLYALFFFVQTKPLFYAQSGYLPAGMTYAEYAQKGFYQLAVVTLINLVLVLGASVFTRDEEGFRRKLLRGLLFLLVVQTGVILFSAAFRLHLYEEVYGFTYTRMFARTMMLMMAILLALLAIRALNEAFPFAKAAWATALLLYVGLNFINIDKIIAEKNVAVYHQNNRLDVDYLTGLSFEATPAVLGVLDRLEVRKGFLEENLRAKYHHLQETKDWRSFNLSRRNAIRLLALRMDPSAKFEPSLDAYY